MRGNVHELAGKVINGGDNVLILCGYSINLGVVKHVANQPLFIAISLFGNEFLFFNVTQTIALRADKRQ